MRRSGRVLCVGLSCLDMVWQVAHFPPRASRTHAHAHARRGGGPAATAAVAAARYGASVRLWAIHGDDEAGRELTRELRAEGVDVSHVHVPEDARTFVSAVLVAPDGERWIFPYRGENLRDDPGAWPLEEVADADVLLTDLRHPRLARAALAAARRAGVPSVVDLGRASDAPDAAASDQLIASREAAEELGQDTARPVVDPGGRLDVPALVAALQRLRTREEQVVAVTLGPGGVAYDPGDGPRHLAAPAVHATDTTGAGDVFHGVWAAALAAGEDPSDVARHATLAAALSCRGPGREAIPRGDEIRTHPLPDPTPLGSVPSASSRGAS